jgi:2-(1,2-epoxy-1,2-dihydrophenyl)acetyl-CoA isomerase
MPELLREQSDHVLTLTLNRPEKKNAIHDGLGWALVKAVREAIRDDSVWVIAITGTGDSFCAGLDLSPDRDTSTILTAQEKALDDLFWVSAFFLALRKECDKPVVAGINGAAVGGGLALAMAADIRIVARSARLIAGYTRIGGSPDGGLSYTLPQAMGYEQAMRFMLENKTVEGEEAVRLGMAGECVDDDKLRARLADYCAGLAQWSPLTLRSTKRVITKATEHRDIETQLRYEFASTVRTFGTEDGQEARKAFLEKRKPNFKGR